ncbi:MAG: helix-turn-helix domain-containing protein [Candidatus Woesearchaeota archaeon]|nr:helix-turn-helix domain-containing protein [Candidatus Woesearchaeota archaeon]MDP7323848.1 helix-turn-helix domain-containing protein [Candidatus Woesearchaeota archaeon]
MKCESYFRFFETVSGKLRWSILSLLENGPMSVNEISEGLNEEQSKISHNLRNLAECHFLDVKQDGKKRIYSLNKETIVPLMKLVEKHVEKYCTDFCKVEK